MTALECGGCGGPIVEGSKLACPRCQTFMRVAAGKMQAFGVIMQNAADAIAGEASPEILAQHASILAEASAIIHEFTKRPLVSQAPKIIS
jgi:hypothetical protein